MPVVYDPRAIRDLKAIPQADRRRLEERLEVIASAPHQHHLNVRPLHGDPGVFRVRHGVWRAVYTITPNGDVRVLRVRHRREVYR